MYNKNGKTRKEENKIIVKAEIKGKKVILSEPKIIVGGENGADKAVIFCNKNYGEKSLAGVPVFIKTENALGEQYKSPLSVEEKQNGLEISWIIGKNDTKVNGELECQISFESGDGEFVLRTLPFKLTVERALPENAIIDEEEQSLIAEFRQEVAECKADLQELAENSVSSVNGQSGEVTLTAAGLGALCEGDGISKLTDDVGYAKTSELVNYATKTQLEGKSSKTFVQGEISSHDGSADAHPAIKTAISSVLAVANAAQTAANNKTKTVTFLSVKDFVDEFKSASASAYSAGDTVRFLVIGLPAIWVSRALSSKRSYTFVDERTTLRSLRCSSYISIGYYDLSLCDPFYGAPKYKVAVSGAEVSLDAGVYSEITLGQNVSVSLTGERLTAFNEWEFAIIQPENATWQVTFPSGIVWKNSAPTLSGGSVHLVKLRKVNGVVYGESDKLSPST